MPPSLTPVDVTPTDITATPAPSAIPSHASVATIPSHVTGGTNNGSESGSLDSTLEIVEMTSPHASTVALSSLSNKIHNSLYFLTRIIIYDMLIFWSSLINMLKYKYIDAKYIMIYLQSFVLLFFNSLNLIF